MVTSHRPAADPPVQPRAAPAGGADRQEHPDPGGPHYFDGSNVQWSVDDIDAGAELSQAEKSQALRITNEALTNAMAHAGASEVIVSLRGDESGVEIVIADDGIAVDSDIFTSAPGHRGLATMRDRAAVVGGWCTVEPCAPHGCTVRLWVPRVRPW